METTYFLAQLLGIFFIITGLSLAVRRKMLLSSLRDVFSNPATTYAFGVLILIAGLGILLIHNDWSTLEASIVTIIAIDMVIEAILYMFLPKKTLKKLFKPFTTKAFYYIAAALYVGFGAFLLLIIM